MDHRVTRANDIIQKKGMQPTAAGQLTSSQPLAATPRTARRRFRPSRKIILGFGIPLILLIALLGWVLYSRSSGTLIESNQYQAVFLNNGSVYFGKLQQKNSQYYTLTDVYYFESKAASANPTSQVTNETSTLPKLIKLGKELHAPEDRMNIEQSQISFFENISSDGAVAKAIAANHK